MNDSTLITMRKDVLEYILMNERSAALQEKNIRSLEELVKARSKSMKASNFTVTIGGKYYE